MKKNRLLIILSTIAAMSMMPMAALAQSSEIGSGRQQSSAHCVTVQNVSSSNPDQQKIQAQNASAQRTLQSEGATQGPGEQGASVENFAPQNASAQGTPRSEVTAQSAKEQNSDLQKFMTQNLSARKPQSEDIDQSPGEQGASVENFAPQNSNDQHLNAENLVPQNQDEQGSNPESLNYQTSNPQDPNAENSSPQSPNEQHPSTENPDLQNPSEDEDSIDQEELPFVDVKPTQWFYSSVIAAVELGLINGIDPIHYMPDRNLTYAQAIKLAACMNEKYTTGEVTLKNGSGYWYDSYVEYCLENGIITENYQSVIDQAIDRQTYAGIFARCLPQEGLSKRNTIPSGSIPDVPAGNENYDGIYTLYKAGILNGKDEKGTFDPESNIKRSEVAAIVNRMMDETVRVNAPARLKTPSDIYDIQEGDLFSFGSYEQDADDSNGKEPIQWMVLKVENGKALLLSRYGLENMRYNETDGYTTWENCTLRTWLNETFFTESFDDEEQSRILETLVENPDTFVGFDSEIKSVRSNTRDAITELEYHSSGGNDTLDKVFLLSIDEAKSLLGYEEKPMTGLLGLRYIGCTSLQAVVTKYAKIRKCFTSSYYVTPEGGACWWWLRSPGCFNDAASLIDEYGCTYSDSVHHSGSAVRPALWVSLSPLHLH